MRKISSGSICYLCVIVLLFIFFRSLFSFLVNSVISVSSIDPSVVSLFAAILFTIIIANTMVTVALSKDISHATQFVQKLRDGKYESVQKPKVIIPAVGTINQAMQEIANEQKQQLFELNESTIQLNEKNIELEDAYMQMESSYGQLQAALDQLNESEQRYHSLVKNIPDIVITLDSMGNITYANRACKEVLEFRRHDIVGKPFEFIIHPQSAAMYQFQTLKQDIEKKGEQQLRIYLKKKDESPIETEIKFTPVQESHQENSLQAIIRDVTEQRRMESTLLETNRRLGIINGFSHKLAMTMELADIYKTCVNCATEELGFYGCLYAMAEKNERLYRIMEYSGEFFQLNENISRFANIHRNAKFLDNSNDSIVFNSHSLPSYLMLKQSRIENNEYFQEISIQELEIGGQAASLLLVVSKKPFSQEELDILRSIGHTASSAIKNAMHLIESKNSYVQTIDALIAAIEAKDQYTRGHSQRVSGLAVKIAQKMGMSRQQAEELRIAGILHDIGKIGISDSILQKKGSLTREEYEEIKKHPAISNKILYPIGLTDRILKAVAFHHERFDGLGYPFGLTNESLGLEPQIIAVADAYDAMTSSRPYREPLSLSMAIQELENNRGKQFHPEIVDIMIQIQNQTESEQSPSLFTPG